MKLHITIGTIIGHLAAAFALDAKAQLTPIWGPPTKGIQMSVALTNPVVTAGQSVLLQCLIINSNQGMPTIPTNVFDEAYSTNPYLRSLESYPMSFDEFEAYRTNHLNKPMQPAITNRYGEVFSTSGLTRFDGLPDLDMQVIISNASGVVYDLSRFPEKPSRPGNGSYYAIFSGTMEKFKIPVNFPRDLKPGHYSLVAHWKLSSFTIDTNHLSNRFPKLFSNSLDIDIVPPK